MSLRPIVETPLRVVIAFTSPFGLAMVLLGREPEPEVEALSKSDLDTPGAGGARAGACSSNIGFETAGVEEPRRTLDTMPCL
ncbi:hypothetical protein Tco_0734085 [Tanacetum coccineum]